MKVDCPKKKPCPTRKKTNRDAKHCFYKDKACRHCKRTNHKEEDCYYKDKNKLSKEDKKHATIALLTANQKMHDETVATTKYEFTVDSGANNHMVNENKMMTKVKNSDEVKIAKKGQSMQITGVGQMKFETCELKDVCVPDLSKNLMSINNITKDLHTLMTRRFIF
jgi:hypothetical protein